MRDGDRHVVPNPGGGWDVKAENAKRASSHHETQAEAIERAREIIRNKGGGELTVHGEDGHIRQKDTVAAEAPSTGGVGAVNLPASARGAATSKPRSASATGGTDAVVATSRADGGMAETDRPLPGTSTVTQRPSFGERLKGLFGRSSR